MLQSVVSGKFRPSRPNQKGILTQYARLERRKHKMNKEHIKKTAQAALDSEYGFKPALDKITLLEASDDRTYILFRVRNHEYRFDSYRFADGSVWCGSGTIEKLS